MDDLLRDFLASFASGAPDPVRLARLLGEDPGPALAEFLLCDAHPGLSVQRDRWLPESIRSASAAGAARSLRALADARGSEGLPPLDLDSTPGLPRLLGASPVLARMLVRAPAWADELEGDPPAAPTRFPAADWSAIRETKYRGLLRIAARDLARRAPCDGLRELSDLADGCLAAALVCASEITGVEAPALLALGKLGGRELNFSSDVDVVFLHSPGPVPDDGERQEGLERLVRQFKSGLERGEADGFAYRVDLELRPEGGRGPLANSVDAALDYYESFGQDWERQMLIRLRHVAGPSAAAQAFRQGVLPFVYRKSIDARILHDVRAMKLRIEAERRGAGRDLEADLKEGPGGIRDVEFLVQALQLLHGGRHVGIRTGNVLDALAGLAQHGLLPEAAAQELTAAYTWLRRAEHAIQMVEERQTQRFPREAPAQLGLARRLRYDDAEAERARTRMLDDWNSVRDTVRSHFDALVLGREP